MGSTADGRIKIKDSRDKKKREVRAAADTMDVDRDSGPHGTMGHLVDKAVAKAVNKLKKVHNSKPQANSGNSARAPSKKGKKGQSSKGKKKKAAAKAASTARVKRKGKKQSDEAMQVDRQEGSSKGKGKARA
ncbi:hypothetical protein APHAL10511_003847 [Amanita phalloides]|nr:hypothetical protein APHAL10511_003847 [Amanita phalloides]